MLNIAVALLGGLILSWFGFYDLASVGMLELFDKEITKSGYYFAFAIFGALNNIAYTFNRGGIVTLTDNLTKRK